MRIGIDIDGVMTDIERFIIDYATKFCYDNNIEYKINPLEYNEYKMLNISEENAEKFWNEYLGWYSQDCPVRPFCIKTIQKLKKENEIYIITARNEYGLPQKLYGTMQQMVKEWLAKNKIEYDRLIFTQDKLKECKENKVDIMIEDCPSIIEKLSDDIKLFCFDADYNKKVSGKNVIRVYSWYDILEKIKINSIKKV